MKRLLAALPLVACLLGPLPALAAPDAYAQAQTAVEAHQWERAETLLKEWLVTYPSDQDARFLLARVLAWQAKYQPALQEYDRLMASAPDNADYWLGKAHVLVWAGRPLEALPLIDRVLAKTPGDESVWRLAIQARLAAGGAHRADVERLSREAKKRFPGSSWPSLASSTTALGLELEVGSRLEGLTNRLAPWFEAYANGTYQIAPHQSAYGTARTTQRFALWDQELMLGYSHPINQALSMQVEGSFSPSHQMLPAWALAGQLAGVLGDGWGAQAELKRTAFTEAAFTRETVTIEKYIGDWRAAYALSLSQLPGNLWPLGHQATLTRYYGDANRVALMLGIGREMQFLTPTQLLTMDVRSAVMSGVHWATPSWGLSYELDWVQQGQAYTRAGGRLGLLHHF